jgi:hypothetical protein
METIKKHRERDQSAVADNFIYLSLSLLDFYFIFNGFHILFAFYMALGFPSTYVYDRTNVFATRDCRQENAFGKRARLI